MGPRWRRSQNRLPHDGSRAYRRPFLCTGQRALSYWLACAIVAGVGGERPYTTDDVAANMKSLLDVLKAVDGDTMIARVV